MEILTDEKILINQQKSLIKNHIQSLSNRYKEINQLKEKNKRLRDIKSIPNKNKAMVKAEYNSKIRKLINEINFLKKGNKELKKRLEKEGLLNTKIVSQTLRNEVFERDNHKCLVCGSTEKLTVDHIFPKSLGGPNIIENLQTMCKECNLKKGTEIVDYRRKNNE